VKAAVLTIVKYLHDKGIGRLYDGWPTDAAQVSAQPLQSSLRQINNCRTLRRCQCIKLCHQRLCTVFHLDAKQERCVSRLKWNPGEKLALCCVGGIHSSYYCGLGLSP